MRTFEVGQRVRICSEDSVFDECEGVVAECESPWYSVNMEITNQVYHHVRFMQGELRPLLSDVIARKADEV